jgi:hypothetical protein
MSRAAVANLRFYDGSAPLRPVELLVFLPLGLLLQKRLTGAPGLIDVARVDELLLVCRGGGG